MANPALKLASYDDILALLRFIDEEGRVGIRQTGRERAQAWIFKQSRVGSRVELSGQFTDVIDP